MTENYPEYRTHLRQLMGRLGKEIPDAVSGFARLHEGTMSEGALGVKHKELIALGIGIAARCGGCLAYHVHGALRAGASRDEILETIGVAIMMGGGPASVYGCEALEALNQFEAEPSP